MANSIIKKRMARIARISIIVLLLGTMGYSAYQILDTNNNYIKEERVREQMAAFRPEHMEGLGDVGEDIAEEEPAVVNRSILDARQLNSDIAGWISMDGTRIDYPFVQAQDNAYYLRRDVNGEYSYAGTIFMDYRCSKDFSDFSTILYGHNMGNGTMFSDIRSYDSAPFFASGETGWLYLADATYKLEVAAYMLVRGDDDIIYSAGNKDDYDKQRFLTYVQESAFRYRDLSLTVSDRLVVLSTCTNTSEEMRSVIIARLVKAARQR